MATTLIFNNLSLLLPSPDFNNDQKIEITRIHAKTRGGDIITYKDPDWPKTETRSMKFSFCSQDQVDQWKIFATESLGQDVTMIDFEGQTVIGLILNPETSISQPGRFNHVIGFDFQMEIGIVGVATGLPFSNDPIPPNPNLPRDT